MPVQTRQISVSMNGNTHIENMTESLRQEILQAGYQAGLLTIFVQHTTASVLIIEDEPGLRADTKTLWDRLVPKDSKWQHNTLNLGEDNGHSHLRGQMQGHSLTVPFAEKQLLLGTWQEIVLVDFDTRARTRQIVVQIMGE